MIRLKMGREPEELAALRKSRLPQAIAAFNAYGHGSKQLSHVLEGGYQVAKETLRSRQHGKCAFCERSEDAFNQPVEHFRPKAAAADFNGSDWKTVVSSHYWWLTWTWSNLFFACDDCNRTGRKGNRFPIVAGSTRIVAPAAGLQRLTRAHYAVAGEQAMLINPRVDDPFKHLQWMPVNSNLPRHQWTWTLEGRDERGEMTVRALDLSYRVDEVNLHLRRMSPTWKAIDRAIVDGRLVDARASWKDLVDTFLADPKQPYRNAVWWALDSLFPASERRRLGFTDFKKPHG